MRLNNPIPGVDPGPDYADNLQSSLNIIDQHDHSAGAGVKVNTNGLNINSDLSFQSNNAIQLRSTQYNNYVSTLSGGNTPGTTPTSIDQCSGYFSGGDFYINNGAGTAVQITNGSSVNAGAGSITGLPSGTASVTFSGGVYVFQNATSTPANIDVGSIVIRQQNTPSSNGLTLSAPAALASGNYGLTLPAVPLSTQFVTLDSSGAIGAGVALAGGIGRNNIEPVGQVYSADQVSDTLLVNGAFAGISNLTLSITTVGKPVMVMLQSTSGNIGSFTVATSGSSGSNTGNIAFFRGASAIGGGAFATSSTTFGNSTTFPASSFFCLDNPGAGTYSYSVQWKMTLSGGSLSLANVRLVAYELT